MKRVLVPLDGTNFSLSILPDAERIAGPDGTLILIRAANGLERDPESHEKSEWYALNNAQDYLEAQAEPLRSRGVAVECHSLYMGAAAESIDESVEMFHADMIACATHGRSPLGRLLRGGVAWKALAHSRVPVLLRHAQEQQGEGGAPAPEQGVVPRRIMVPLDGSIYAETALPLAQELAHQWAASLWLVRVVPDDALATAPDAVVTLDDRQIITRSAHEYLDRLAATMQGEVYPRVFGGPVAGGLVAAAEQWCITDIVMASHGRTGLSRAVLGSVADALVHELHCPIIVIPALAAGAVETIPARVGAFA